MEVTKNTQAQVIPGDPSMRTKNNPKLSTRANGESLRVLSEEDWQFWLDNGYVIIKNAISKEQAAESAAFIWEFEGKDPNDKKTWYKVADTHHKMQELNNSGMVELYNNQILWNNRQRERVHQAFADIWSNDKLWVSIDRANLNFPVKPGYEHKGFIHWDYDPETKPQSRAIHCKGNVTIRLRCCQSSAKSCWVWKSGKVIFNNNQVVGVQIPTIFTLYYVQT